MTTPATCPDCGAPLGSAARGLCPRCLAEMVAAGNGLELAADPEVTGETNDGALAVATADNKLPDELVTSGLSDPGGAMIGRYKLLEKLGEGGFGIVYVAQQLEPVQRRVALKIIKPGMDTREVVARFEAERQALALMEHENIAKVLDGGATEAGRPYFVLELVPGVPITQFCDEKSLSTKERLQIFVQV